MILDTIKTNDTLRLELYETIKNKKVSHAYLFTGQKGAGKMILARLFAAAILCENEACGECICCKKVQNDSHPDVIILDNEDASIKIEQIRGIRQDAYILPNEAEKKVYIINHADKMTAQAQNSLLKVLEEPPSFVHFILLSDKSDLLLDTITSRCVQKRLVSFETDNSDNELCKIFFEKLFSNDLYGYLLISKKLNSKVVFTEFAESLTAFVRDIMLSNNTDKQKGFSYAESLTNKAAINIISFIKKSLIGLEANAAIPQTALCLFLRCWEEVH